MEQINVYYDVEHVPMVVLYYNVGNEKQVVDSLVKTIYEENQIYSDRKHSKGRTIYPKAGKNYDIFNHKKDIKVDLKEIEENSIDLNDSTK